MNVKREIVVTRCEDCPFMCYPGEQYCGVTQRPIEGDFNQDHPDCPLRQGPITVRLSKIVMVP